MSGVCASDAETTKVVEPDPSARRIDSMTEAARLEALDRYDILDTPREEAFDRLTRLARKIFRMPMVSITLVDGHRQWFKSCVGVSDEETPRGPAFCNVAVRSETPLVVHDARLDPHFADNVFVTGDPNIRFYAGAPLRSPEGQVLGTLCVMDSAPRVFDADDVETLCELAQVVMDEMELRLLANFDPLTHAMSRRAFCEEAVRALSLAGRHGHEFSLIAFDLDRFKSVNDVHGHGVGDVVLARSIAACLTLLRGSDSIGRLGGEEFAVLLPHTGIAEAMDVAERLRIAIATERYGAGAETFRVTASFGVAAKSRGLMDIDRMFAEADAALYVAKHQGRNRCVAAKTTEGPNNALLRRRVLKGGQILFNRRLTSRECTIRSLWDTGAGLDVSSAAGLPDRFELAIEADDVIRPCRLVNIAGRRLEVEFEAA